MSNVSVGWTKLEEEVRHMIEIAEQTYKKELDGCSFKYGTILTKMANWIGSNSSLSYYIEDWFKEHYYDVWLKIDKYRLCYSHLVVIELLDISALDNMIRNIVKE